MGPVLTVALLLFVLVDSTHGSTCAECTAQYGTDKGAATDDPTKCTAIKGYLTCLETSARNDTGCPFSDSSTITDDYAAITCSLDALCTCQKDFWATDITTSAGACTAAKARVSCLRGQANPACDGTSAIDTLGTKSKTIIEALTSPACTLDASCTCELDYVRADIGTNAKKCTETKKFMSCLKSKTGNDCKGDKTVKTLAEAGNAVISGLGADCTIANTDACKCEIDWAIADISDAGKKCTQVKTFIGCLKDKTGTGCDGTTTVAQLAEAAGTYAGTLTDCIQSTTVCYCDMMYAKADISDNAKKCTANKDYISCLLGKTGTGCDGSSSLITLATAAKNAITTIGSSCTKTSVCDCEIAYAMADISDNSKKCTETKTLTTCIQLSIEGGCGSSTTKTNVGTVAQDAFTALTSTNCALTSTCQCQVDFNKASVTAANKCTSANALVNCLNNITSTTEKGCDGTVLTSDLKTNVTSTVQSVLCSSPGIRGSAFIAILMLITSVLITSP